MAGIGLVGFGYWGPNLARNFALTPSCRLVSICDLSPERTETAARMYPYVRTTQDYDDLLKDDDIDAIIIATPVASHYGLAKKALKAGKDVLVEKPLTQSAKEAAELVSLAAEARLILAVDHTFLFTGAVKKIKEIVDSGEIGELLYIDSVRINLGLFQPDVNVLYDLAPHDLSIVCHLVDEDPIRVRAMGASHAEVTIENLVYLHLEYPSGLVAHLHLSWLAPVKIRQTLIAGTNKMVVYDDLERTEKVKIYDRGIEVTPDRESLNKIKIDYRTGDMVAPKLIHREALNAEAENFVESVLNRTPPLCGGNDGLRVVKILEAAQHSLRNRGKKVYLEEI